MSRQAIRGATAKPWGIDAVIRIDALKVSDRARWEVLARGYKTFYETALPDAEYKRAWSRLMQGDGVHGLGAHLDGRLVGITHYLFHPSVWSADVCYLQDLFTDSQFRGQGVARALIAGVADAAKARAAPRLYWLTHSDNATARALYDKVAACRGFVRYDFSLG
jgi:GNAT superfamily N-acetyltransferase